MNVPIKFMCAVSEEYKKAKENLEIDKSVYDEKKLLDRIIYLCDIRCQYVAGDPEKHSLKSLNDDFLVVLVEKCPNYLLKQLFDANEDELLPRRISLHYILAKCLHIARKNNNSELSNRFAMAAAVICSKSDEEYFNFIKWFSIFNNNKSVMPTCLATATRKFLDIKTDDELNRLLLNKGYHGWTYKDLIKLSHYSAKDNEYRKYLLLYILFGNKKIDEIEEKCPGLWDEIDLLKKLHETKDAQLCCRLLRALGADIQHVNNELKKDPQVWDALIKMNSSRYLLELLIKNSKIKKNLVKNVSRSVNQKLSRSNINSHEKISPIELFIFKQNFEKGGKPNDPHFQQYIDMKAEENKNKTKKKSKKSNKSLELHSKEIITVIKDSLMYSTEVALYRDYLRCLRNKKIFISLDVTENKIKPCFQNKNISCSEAALSIIMFLLRTSAVECGYNFEGDILANLSITEDMSFEQGLQLIQRKKSSFILPTACFYHALRHNKDVDLFINFIHSPDSLKSIPTNFKNKSLKRALRNYQTVRRRPNCKLITICLGHHQLPSMKDSLMINGFFPNIIEVISCYLLGCFY